VQLAISIDRLTLRARLGESVVNVVPATPDQELTRALDAAMDRFATGDDSAFADLYRLAAPQVNRFLIRLSGDAALADDLTQDTFLRAHAARGGYEVGASARPWLLAIARNTFLDSTRRAKVRRKSAEATKAAQDADPPVAAGETQGDEALAAREMLEIVNRVLEKQSALVREAFILVRFEGLSMSEAAEVLGTTEAAVKVRAFRANEAVREALGPDALEGRGRS
jgi:RNA polymerase sigma-70 factor (ECF subfamily)